MRGNLGETTVINLYMVPISHTASLPRKFPILIFFSGFLQGYFCAHFSSNAPCVAAAVATLPAQLSWDVHRAHARTLLANKGLSSPQGITR